jgi:hypothetical protein
MRLGCGYFQSLEAGNQSSQRRNRQDDSYPYPPAASSVCHRSDLIFVGRLCIDERQKAALKLLDGFRCPGVANSRKNVFIKTRPYAGVPEVFGVILL